MNPAPLARLLPVWAALLSPQGKILFDFLVTEGDGALLLDVAAPAAELLLRKLKMYRLRARVEIEARPQLGVYVNLSGHPDIRPTPYADRAITFPDPRHPGLGLRSIGAHAEMPANLPGPAAYHQERLRLCIPEGSDFGTEKIFALDAGLEELHGVSFTKGCYIGQELTARTHYRALIKKRLMPVTVAANVAPGTPIHTGDGLEAGEHAQAGGLAAAGGPDEDEELPLGDVKVQVGDGGLGAAGVDERDVVVVDALGHGASIPSTGRNVPDDPSGRCRPDRAGHGRACKASPPPARWRPLLRPAHATALHGNEVVPYIKS